MNDKERSMRLNILKTCTYICEYMEENNHRYSFYIIGATRKIIAF